MRRTRVAAGEGGGRRHRGRMNALSVTVTGRALPLTGVFVQRFSSTPRGARLARRLVLHQLDTWGVPHGSEASDTAALLVAELAANAVTHGCVPGRDFEVTVAIRGRTLCIAVSDARGNDGLPPRASSTLDAAAGGGRPGSAPGGGARRPVGRPRPRARGQDDRGRAGPAALTPATAAGTVGVGAATAAGTVAVGAGDGSRDRTRRHRRIRARRCRRASRRTG